MCGIAGFVSKDHLRQGDISTLAHSMGEAIRHRGPDDSGVWTQNHHGVGFVHRRLSILDLSPEGHQPMRSPNGRYTVIYNGEIYNYLELRNSLTILGYSFHGHSDTEVMLAAIEAWGLMEAVQKFAGMFAFALWDSQDNLLHLVRDRLGIKPLYYGWINSSFVFGSELNAIKVFPGFNSEINRDALALLMRHNYIPEPYSIYSSIAKLSPGNILSLSPSALSSPRIHCYWNATEIAESGIQNRFKGNEAEAIERLDSLLGDIIGSHMVSDVPLGAFLSGGFDSTMVVAQMQARSQRPIKTFSIGFQEEKYNEAQHAKLIAEHLQTEHTELYVTPEDALAVIPQLPSIYDEPFADSSQIPTFLVSKLAREKVTVSLSGDGGDELFGGYNRYQQGMRLWNKINVLPKPLWPATAQCVRFLRHSFEGKNSAASFLVSSVFGVASAENSLRKLSDVLETRSFATLYLQLMSHWTSPADLVLNSHEPFTVFSDRSRQIPAAHTCEQMMLLDLMSYLPGDILTKVDRASMAVSLEARVPLLDHRLVEFAWQLPLDMKIHGDQGKWVFRRVLDKYVPYELMNRPKMGFALPVDSWLKNQLREWAEELLDETKLNDQGFFNAQIVRQKWTEYLDGQNRWYPHLWTVLMFQAWLDAN